MLSTYRPGTSVMTIGHLRGTKTINRTGETIVAKPERCLTPVSVTLDGQKIPLGFVQAATENERVCRRFLSDLVDRGLQYEAGLLVVMDGAKGLYKAVMSVLKGHACVQRCQYHKRQNVVSYLSKSAQSGIGRKMEAAYGKPTYEAAKKALAALKPSLELMNQSALHSLEEGMEETLTLHRLGLTPMLKGFLPHHQLHRERQQSPGAAHAQRTAMDQLITAPPLGSHGTARHRTTSA